MKTFNSVVVLKRQRHELWTIMRDHLAEFAGNVADIREIRELERHAGSDGTIDIVNEWHARQQIPAAIRAMLKIDEISWIDRNRWDPTTQTCFWAIEPRFLADHIVCRGQTGFSEAMGGRGTRLTFSGDLEIRPGLLGSLGGMERAVTGFVEAIVTTIIPRNLRAVAEAAAAFGA